MKYVSNPPKQAEVLPSPNPPSSSQPFIHRPPPSRPRLLPTRLFLLASPHPPSSSYPTSRILSARPRSSSQLAPPSHSSMPPPPSTTPPHLPPRPPLFFFLDRLPVPPPRLLLSLPSACPCPYSFYLFIFIRPKNRLFHIFFFTFSIGFTLQFSVLRESDCCYERFMVWRVRPSARFGFDNTATYNCLCIFFYISLNMFIA